MDGWIDRSFASFIVTPRRASDRETERLGRSVIWTVRRAPASRVVDPRVASRVVRPRSRLTDEFQKMMGDSRERSQATAMRTMRTTARNPSWTRNSSGDGRGV
jgi:hypothetical protein